MKVSIQNPTLPPDPEVEVIYQSWDPPSGGYYLYLEAEVSAGEWVPVTYGQWAALEGRTMKSVDREDNPIQWPDDEDSQYRLKRIALRYARTNGVPTRVIRQQALL